jgi:glycosyltransferase involved in cell wall biosynthesis
VGDRPDEEVFDFLELATQRESEIRALFTGLGERAALLGKVERLAAKIASKEQEHQRLEEHLQRVSQDAERAREEAVVASNALEEAKGTCDALHGEVARRDRVIADILESRSWRMTRPLREAKASLPAVRAALRPIKRRLLTPGKPPAISVLPCSHRGSDESAAGARQVRVNGPLISIVMPVYNPPRQFLERAIDSVKRQSYPRWELCVCDDGSTSDVVGVVLGNASADDERVRVTRSETNEGISAASNRALDLATGEYVAFLDNDDELAVDALLECANVLADGPEIDILYTDEDKIDANGSRSDPFFKPDWSPNMFRGVMYVGHLLVARRSLVMDVKGFDPRFDTVQDYELMLRLSERTERITHLPKILYHWRKIPGSVAADINAKEAVPRQQVDAVNAHLRRCGIRAVARAHPRLPHRVQLQAEARTDWPPVSVVFASDRPQRARRCLEAILQTTTYPDFEVIVAAPSQTDELQRMSSVKTVVLDKAAFTVPAGVNTAARTADGDILVLLQDNVAGVTPDWLEALVWPLETPRVGAVGPVLTSSGGSVQSAGLVLRPSQHKAFEDALSGFSNDADGFAGSLSCAREVSSVRAACIAVAQSTFSECGGFREDFRAGAYGVDLCLRIRRGGSDVLCAPHAVLTLDGENDDDPMDHALLLDVWRDVFKDGDPYYRQELPLSA